MGKSKAVILKQLLPLLTVLERTGGSERKALLSYMNKDATLGLRECIDNCTRNDKDGDEYRHELTEKLGGSAKKQKAIQYLLQNKADRPDKRNRERLMELSDSLDPVFKSSIARVERFLQQQQAMREAKKVTKNMMMMMKYTTAAAPTTGVPKKRQNN